ncbi:MAG TPA: hypothetical protein VNJ28_08620, partial [Candidatus Limnocylindrales bacterium]|nr:hypothetical protein [Candidatus Limnocylindrales bacterium]
LAGAVGAAAACRAVPGSAAEADLRERNQGRAQKSGAEDEPGQGRAEGGGHDRETPTVRERFFRTPITF